MSQTVKGSVLVDEEAGIVAIHVPERGLVGLLRMENFRPERSNNGQIGVLGDGQGLIPVYVLKRSKRAKVGAAAR